MSTGSEEYLDSEKYEVRSARSTGRCCRSCAAERDPPRQPGIQYFENVELLETESEHLFAFAKRGRQYRGGGDVNLDPTAARDGLCIVPAELGLPPAFAGEELLDGCRSSGASAATRAPRAGPSHIVRVTVSRTGAVAPGRGAPRLRALAARAHDASPKSSAGAVVRVRPAVVQARRLLRDPHPRLLRLQRRRLGRPARAPRQARLPAVARRRLHLAAADVRLARSATAATTSPTSTRSTPTTAPSRTSAAFVEAAHERGIRSSPTSSSTTPPPTTPGSRSPARAPTTRSATGTSGRTPTTATRTRASSSSTPSRRTGRGTRSPAPTTGTASSPTSPT